MKRQTQTSLQSTYHATQCPRRYDGIARGCESISRNRCCGVCTDINCEQTGTCMNPTVVREWRQACARYVTRIAHRRRHIIIVRSTAYTVPHKYKCVLSHMYDNNCFGSFRRLQGHALRQARVVHAEAYGQSMRNAAWATRQRSSTAHRITGGSLTCCTSLAGRQPLEVSLV